MSLINRNRLLVLVWGFGMVLCLKSKASTLPIFSPDGSLILVMQSVSDQVQPDADEWSLFQAIAEPAQDQQGNSGKVIATPGNEFVLSCATNNGVTHSMDCTIRLSPSPYAKISILTQTADFKMEGEAAKLLHQKFAGSNPAQDWNWKSSLTGLRLHSTEAQFQMHYSAE